jgi:hypothetical protein
LLGEQLPEHLLGPVIQDHAALDHAGHGVDDGEGGEWAGRRKRSGRMAVDCSIEQTPQYVRACKWNPQASDGSKIRIT